jgi:4-hydroxybenzoyl-CoA thioesterase/acyl-CoA thioester hydrolase
VLHDAKGTLGFPKLSARCDYQRPARYEELMDMFLRVSCHDGKSLLYEIEFRCGDEKLACGELRVALCRFPADQPPYAVPISDDVMGRLFGRVE